ncbi:MAG: hypothetical protein AAGJ87_11470 [Pseudomonadota bacterium]
MLQSLIWRVTPKFGARKAALRGVAGFSGSGSVHLKADGRGGETIFVSVVGAAGRSARVFGDGVAIADVPLRNGRGHARVRTPTARLSRAPDAAIEIKQNGDVILAGRLTSRRA